ncbi:MAG: arylmalonate decarboxylase [bacterium]|nr:arylmalonate decarboxylase [bacterium]
MTDHASTRARPCLSPGNEGQGRHARGRLGFILLDTEETADDDIRAMVPWDVGVFITRVRLADPVTVQNLTAVAGDLGDAARLLPERLDAIAYVCTSGSIAAGEAAVERAIRSAQPETSPLALVTCVVDAMRHLGIARVAVGTPYLDEVNRMEAAFLEDRGFDVSSMRGLGIARGRDMTRVEPRDIVRLALDVCTSNCDGIFLSCTALRAVEVIETIEDETGKPVVTSNQALVWRMLRQIGIHDSTSGPGRLFRLPEPVQPAVDMPRAR